MRQTLYFFSLFTLIMGNVFALAEDSNRIAGSLFYSVTVRVPYGKSDFTDYFSPRGSSPLKINYVESSSCPVGPQITNVSVHQPGNGWQDTHYQNGVDYYTGGSIDGLRLSFSQYSYNEVTCTFKIYSMGSGGGGNPSCDIKSVAHKVWSDSSYFTTKVEFTNGYASLINPARKLRDESAILSNLADDGMSVGSLRTEYIRVKNAFDTLATQFYPVQQKEDKEELANAWKWLVQSMDKLNQCF